MLLRWARVEVNWMNKSPVRPPTITEAGQAPLDVNLSLRFSNFTPFQDKLGLRAHWYCHYHCQQKFLVLPVVKREGQATSKSSKTPKSSGNKKAGSGQLQNMNAPSLLHSSTQGGLQTSLELLSTHPHFSTFQFPSFSTFTTLPLFSLPIFSILPLFDFPTFQLFSFPTFPPFSFPTFQLLPLFDSFFKSSSLNLYLHIFPNAIHFF